MSGVRAVCDVGGCNSALCITPRGRGGGGAVSGGGWGGVWQRGGETI